MTGYLLLTDGRTLKLPPASSWRACHGWGEACDCFEYRCPVDLPYARELDKVRRFRAEQDGETVFFGVLDESRIAIGTEGLTLFLSGRGMAALLLDNQPGAASYVKARLSDILAAYVTPYGVALASADALGEVAGFEVSASASCYSALADFARSAAGLVPRFSLEGGLILSASGSGKKDLTLDRWGEAMLTLRRYGVISELYIVETGGSLRNEAAYSRGIRCRRVVQSAAGAAYKLAEAEKDYITLTVTVPKAFAAFPADPVTIACGLDGFDGNYLAVETESAGGAGGEFCTLTLKKA